MAYRPWKQVSEARVGILPRMEAATANLTEFASACDDMNQIGDDGTIRRYQRAILDTGYLVIGGQVASASCVVGDQVAYRFEVAGEPVWVLTQTVADGFPLKVACTLDGHQERIGGLRGFNADLASKAQSSLLHAERAQPILSDSTKPWLVVGNANFAHHAWNELGALLAAGDHEVDATLLFEPLGPLSALAPNLTINERPQLPTGRAMRGQTFVRLGATMVTQECQSAILGHAAATVSPAAHELLANIADAPVIWLNIRIDRRACLNINEFLASLIKEFLREIPGCRFVFDGFSYPADYEGNPRYDAHRAVFRERETDTAAAIDALLCSLPSELRDRCASVNGWGILDAILVAGKADYYVSHAGSIQHKIGWFHATPGFIHAPPPVGAAMTALLGWHASMSGRAALPTGLFEDEVEVASAEDANSRNWNYRIREPERVAARVVGTAVRALGLSGQR